MYECWGCGDYFSRSRPHLFDCFIFPSGFVRDFALTNTFPARLTPLSCLSLLLPATLDSTHPPTRWFSISIGTSRGLVSSPSDHTEARRTSFSPRWHSFVSACLRQLMKLSAKRLVILVPLLLVTLTLSLLYKSFGASILRTATHRPAAPSLAAFSTSRATSFAPTPTTLEMSAKSAVEKIISEGHVVVFSK